MGTPYGAAGHAQLVGGATPELDFKVSSGASGGLDGAVSAGLSEEVMHQLRPAGPPGGFSDLEKA